MIPFVFDLHDVDATNLSEVGGKGANLGALIKIAGIHVPDGFCVSTAAFKKMIDGVALDPLYRPHGGRRPRRWRHSRHRLHGPELDTAVCIYQRSGHRSWQPHEPRRRNRPRIRAARSVRRGKRDQADPRWPTNTNAV